MSNEFTVPPVSPEELTALLDRLPIAAALLSPQGDSLPQSRFVYANELFLSLTDSDATVLRGYCLEELFPETATRLAGDATYIDSLSLSASPGGRRLRLSLRSLSSQLILAALEDRTEHFELLQELDFTRRWLAALSGSAGELMFDLRLSNKALTFAEGCCDESDFPLSFIDVPESLVAGGFLHSEDIEPFNRAVAQLLDTKKSATCLLRFRTSLKRDFLWHRLQLTMLSNRTTSAVGSLRDVHSEILKQLNVQLKATTDPLTHLFNGGIAEELVRQSLADAPGDKLSHALFLIDFNDLSADSDEGESRRATILGGMGNLLPVLFRSGDVMGRVGEDRFLVFARDVPSADFVSVRCREICRAVMNNLSQNSPTTVAIGAALCNTGGQSYDAMYAWADSALSSARMPGRSTFAVSLALCGESGKC